MNSIGIVRTTHRKVFVFLVHRHEIAHESVLAPSETTLFFLRGEKEEECYLPIYYTSDEQNVTLSCLAYESL